MSTNKTNNKFRLVGFLQETTLDERVSSDGQKFITGSITIAVDEFSKHRIHYKVFENTSKKQYDAVSKFLPDNVISVASYLKSTPTANFVVASSMAAKVWAVGQLEEYTTRSGEREKTTITLKGSTLGYCDENREFIAGTQFNVDAYIESLEEEIEDEKETGRLLVSALVPAYKGILYRINFITPAENNAAKFMREKYKPGDFANLSGEFVSMRVSLENKEAEAKIDSFGQANEPQYTTRFVRERRLTGGNKIEAFMTKDEITQGLVLREELIEKNSQRKAAKSTLATEEEKVEKEEAPVEQVVPTKSSAIDNDFDF